MICLNATEGLILSIAAVSSFRLGEIAYIRLKQAICKHSYVNKGMQIRFDHPKYGAVKWEYSSCHTCHKKLAERITPQIDGSIEAVMDFDFD